MEMSPSRRATPMWMWANIAVAVFLCGCTTLAERADHAASGFGFQRFELEGEPFRHVAYFKPGMDEATLHVYIEHDGTPWTSSTQPAADPTPRRLLMLELMAMDRAPALYLGRPCYFGGAAQPPCEAIWWTHRRFSRQVIVSMEAALGSFLRGHPGYRNIEFYGFSGGGVIATLMAAEVPGTRRLVTVASPLDIDAWTMRHQYTPLTGSLSPVQQPPLPAGIAQFHLVGADDKVVISEMIRPFVLQQPDAELVEVAGFDHYCCWERIWIPAILGQK